MELHQTFNGIMTAVVTPFHNDLSIDFDSLKKLLDFQKKSGIHGVIVNGTTGESPTLSLEETELLLEVFLSFQDENFKIYANCGTNDTQKTVDEAKRFAQFRSSSGKKVDGIMIIVPYYNKPSARGILQHYSAVAEAVPANTPLCLYHHPGRTGVHVKCETIVELFKKYPQFVAIKDASASNNFLAEVRLAFQKINRPVNILLGDDSYFLPGFICGATGVISVVTNAIPHVFLKAYECIQNNDLQGVRDLHLKSFHFQTQLFSVTNPIGIKFILKKLGFIQNDLLRLPLCSPDEKESLPLLRLFEESKAQGLFQFPKV